MTVHTRRNSKLLTALIPLTWLACQSPEPELESTTAALVRGCESRRSGQDADRDKVDDGEEQCALERFAPIVHLADDENLWPTNVDWYMQRSSLGFHHQNCGSCNIIASPVSQPALLTAAHHRKGGLLSGCTHTKDLQRITETRWDPNNTFYMDVNDAFHGGSRQPSVDWWVYGHAYANEMGGMDVQYHMFYAYSDARLGDHEGDWETVAVRTNRAGDAAEVVMFAHGHPRRLSPRELQWHGTHPRVFAGSGTHASYESRQRCDADEGAGNTGCPAGTRVFPWYTWPGGLNEVGGRGYQGLGIANLGERDRPLNGQQFIQAKLLWGEPATFDDGPMTPSFGNAWDTRPEWAQPQPGGGHSPETCEDPCGPNMERNGSCQCACSQAAVSACESLRQSQPRYYLGDDCSCYIRDGD